MEAVSVKATERRQVREGERERVRMEGGWGVVEIEREAAWCSLRELRLPHTGSGSG